MIRYAPKNENETYDIMNLLEERLSNSSPSIVLGVTKVFLNYAALENNELYQSVLERVTSKF